MTRPTLPTSSMHSPMTRSPMMVARSLSSPYHCSAFSGSALGLAVAHLPALASLEHSLALAPLMQDSDGVAARCLWCCCGVTQCSTGAAASVCLQSAGVQGRARVSKRKSAARRPHGQPCMQIHAHIPDQAQKHTAPRHLHGQITFRTSSESEAIDRSVSHVIFWCRARKGSSSTRRCRRRSPRSRRRCRL